MVNLRTGKRTRLEGLTAAILRNAVHYNAGFGPRMFTRSPDGEWLLWSSNGHAPTHDKPVTARMDGSGYHEWNGPSDAHWIDRHRWTSYSYTQAGTHAKKEAQYLLLVHDAAHPEAKQDLSDASSQTHSLEPRSQAQSPDAVLYAITHGRDGKIMYVVMRRPEGWPRDQSLVLWDSLMLTANGVWSSKADPAQRRLVMLFHENGVPVSEGIIRSVFPNSSYYTHPAGRMYLYDADKKELKEIGHLEEKSSSGQEFARPDWMPDGRHIQFFYKDALYSAKID